MTGPKLIEVWADTVGRSTCRDRVCGAAITWGEVVASGKKMCFTGEPVVLRTTERNGRTIEAYDFEDNHWKTCPGARSFKGTRING